MRCGTLSNFWLFKKFIFFAQLIVLAETENVIIKFRSIQWSCLGHCNFLLCYFISMIWSSSILEFKQSRNYTWEKIWAQILFIITTGNEKVGFTTVVTISAKGKSSPLILIGSELKTIVERNWFGIGYSINTQPDARSFEFIPNQMLLKPSPKAHANPTFSPASLTDHSQSNHIYHSTIFLILDEDKKLDVAVPDQVPLFIIIKN